MIKRKTNSISSYSILQKLIRNKTNALEISEERVFNRFSTIRMAKTLYIIGNGFDRYHGLSTSYQLFAFFLKARYSDIYDLFTKYYGLPDLDINNINSYWNPHWAQFESALADLDFESVLDDNTDYIANPGSEDFRDRDWHAYQIEMERIVNKLTKDLFKAFKEFILRVDFPDTMDGKLLLLEHDSIFLSFNYTDTLEKYYGIKPSRIVYIHGRAKSPYDTLILGHGVDPAEFGEDEEKQPEGLSEEELERWQEYMANKYDYSYSSGKDELMSYFYSSYKSTDEIIKNNLEHFQEFSKVKKIIVLGHSISKVDQPYFKKIIDMLDGKAVIWTVTYHSDSELISHLENLVSLGVNKTDIELIKIETLRPQQPTLFD